MNSPTQPAAPPAIDFGSFDLSRQADQGCTIELRHPASGQPLGIFIDILGADSTEYVERAQLMQRARMAKMQQSRRFMPTPEELDAEALELVVTATRGWRNVQENGEPLPFSAEAARRLYSRHRWVREQVDAEVNDRANFLPKSANA